MNNQTLLNKFRTGDRCTDEELLTLRAQLKYYSGNTMSVNNWFSDNLSSLELDLLKSGAYTYLLQVEDILKARKII